MIKVGEYRAARPLRLSAPYSGAVKGVNRSDYFADRNTSKRSLTLDMKNPKAVEIARRLLAASDVVANNFTPDVMARFGLAYEDARRIRPDIVYLAMSMQGSSGPESRYLGFGASMAALTGLQHLTGLPGREPIGTGTNYPDHIPNPCHAAFAVGVRGRSSRAGTAAPDQGHRGGGGPFRPPRVGFQRPGGRLAARFGRGVGGHAATTPAIGHFYAALTTGEPEAV